MGDFLLQRSVGDFRTLFVCQSNIVVLKVSASSIWRGLEVPRYKHGGKQLLAVAGIIRHHLPIFGFLENYH